MEQAIKKSEHELFIKNGIEPDKDAYLNLITLKFGMSTYREILENEQIIFRISPLERRCGKIRNEKFSMLDICVYYSMEEIEQMKEKLLEITEMKMSDADVISTLHYKKYNIGKICEKYFEIPAKNRQKEWGEYVLNLKNRNQNKNAHFNERLGEVEIAVFFKSFSYLNGLVELIKEDSYKNFFKLAPRVVKMRATPPNTKSKQYDLFLDIFIKKSYVLNIYEQEQIPVFLTDILTYNDTIVDQCENNKVQNSMCFYSDLKTKYKRELYEHQKTNILRMMQIEKEIENETKVETMNIPHGAKAFPVNEIDDFLYVDTKTKKLLSTDKLDQVSIWFKGGVLCDNIGMGKSTSIVGLIVETWEKDQNPTLVLCPPRLCNQWKEEVSKTYDLNTVIVANIRQYVAFLKRPMISYDIVILSYAMFANQKYLSQKNQSQFDFTEITWKRVIYDELHEQLNYKLFKKRETKNTTILHNVLELKSTYHWICSGTPYFDRLSLCLVIMFLTTIKTAEPKIEEKETWPTGRWPTKNFSLYSEYKKFVSDHVENKEHNYSIQQILCEFERRYGFIINMLSSRIFIKSETNAVGMCIPEPEIKTEFLEADPIEKCIYESALNDKRDMVKMCSHILVASDCEKILGSKMLSLEQIHRNMTSHYGKCIQESLCKLEKALNKGWGASELTLRLQWMGSHNRDLHFDKNTIDTGYVSCIIQNITCFIRKIENEVENEKIELISHVKLVHEDLQKIVAKYNIFTNFEINSKENNTCPICFEELSNNMYVVLPCTHMFCLPCMEKCLSNKKENCSICREKIDKKKYHIVRPNTTNKWGTKIAFLINWVQEILESVNTKIIIFTQWEAMLKILKNVLDDQQISSVSISGPLNIVSSKIRKFKLDSNVRIMLLSSDKASSGLNLQEASHVVLFDTNNDPFTEKQAIGRCVRIGQTKTVQVLRLIMKGTIEEQIFQKHNYSPSSTVIPM